MGAIISPLLGFSDLTRVPIWWIGACTARLAKQDHVFLRERPWEADWALARGDLRITAVLAADDPRHGSQEHELHGIPERHPDNGTSHEILSGLHPNQVSRSESEGVLAHDDRGEVERLQGTTTLTE